jgi:S-adenosylmethionine hydrolase
VKRITLTTDFGLTDWFVGTMKGVILTIQPRAVIVDLNHGIPRGNIQAGAFSLAASYHFFPRQTIHVAVVDPGVGSRRPSIAVQTANYFFVGPDNGVLSLALSRERIKTIRRLDNEKYFLSPVSYTFHGRDIFAPVAAHMSKGLPMRGFGSEQKDYFEPGWAVAGKEKNARRIRGEVIYIDQFGNAITNIAHDQLRSPETCMISIRREFSCPVRRFYEEAPARKLTGILGSNGLLELAVKNGSATEKFGLKVGDDVIVKRHSAHRE